MKGKKSGSYFLRPLRLVSYSLKMEVILVLSQTSAPAVRVSSGSRVMLNFNIANAVRPASSLMLQSLPAVTFPLLLPSVLLWASH